MKNAILLSLVAVGMTSAQTLVGVSSGIMEQSGYLGTNVAVQANVEQYLGDSNFSVKATYQYAFMQTGTAVYFNGGQTISQTPPGSKFQQAQILLGYSVRYEEVVSRFYVGAARQISGPIRPTFELGFLVLPDSFISPSFTWSPVIRDSFTNAPGWNHSVLLGINFKL